MEVEGKGHTEYECTMCRMRYRSATAARICEDIHLDERTGTRNRD